MAFDIPLSLDRDFELQLERLVTKYGEKFEKLNGLHSTQLNFSSFIDNFIDKTTADASIDSNANASAKDVRSLMNEMSKPQLKLFCFNKLYYEMKKFYGKSTADEWIENEFSGAMYMHDAATCTLLPYCFRGDTRIITNKGIFPIASLVGQEVRIINRYGYWEDGMIHYFGKQPIRMLILERHAAQKIIYVTGNHHWFIRNQKSNRARYLEVTTDELKAGMKIPHIGGKLPSYIQPSPFGVAHGFYMGDGDKGIHMRANFCGDKVALIPYFTPANVNGTEKEYTVSAIPKFFKNLPSLDENSQYLYGWLAGYFAADGCVDECGRCTLASTKIEYLEFAQNVLAILGVSCADIRYQDRVSNLTHEMGRVYTLTLPAHVLPESFFIRPTHRERIMAAIENRNRVRHDWSVRAVIDTGTVEDVYCAIVPGSHSFTLEGGVATSNCFAFSIERLAREGLFFLNNYKPKPAQHLNTFMGFVREFVATMSTQSSGATGIPDLLAWSFYFWKKDVESGYMLKDPEYYAKQAFQNIIFTLNQKCLRIVEPAFTNVSIVDHFYAEDLFGGIIYPDGSMFIDHIEEFMQFQKWFMEVFTEIKNSEVFAFPVVTYCLLYKDGKFQDEEFAKWCSDHNTLFYDANFFQSGSTGILSNCCFDASQEVEVVDGDAETTDDARVVTFKELADIAHEKNIWDYKVRDQNNVFKPARLIILPRRPMKRVELVDGSVILETDNHINATARGPEFTADLTLQDELMKLEPKTDKHIFVKIKSITDYDSSDPNVYCFEMADQNDPYFMLANKIVSHNCRLLSDTKKIAAFINSIGGSALSIGSVKVNTINLKRIALEIGVDKNSGSVSLKDFEEKYIEKLKERVLLCCKILHVQRHTIKRTYEKGLLPMFCDGGFDFSHMYSTCGLNSLFETMESFGYIEVDEFGNHYYTPEADAFAVRILNTINEVKDEFTKDKDYLMNVEQIPGEQAAVKFCQKDNLLYGDDGTFMRGNQWIPLVKQATIAEKIRVCSLLDKMVNGGAILHLNIENRFASKEEAWKTLNYIASQGVFYFAFNPKILQCEDHHVFMGTDHCPECGKPVENIYSRTIGYIRPVKAFSEHRKKEFGQRKWHTASEATKTAESK